MFADQRGDQHRGKCRHRSDAEIDAAGENDKRHPDRRNPKHRIVRKQIRDDPRAQEPVVQYRILVGSKRLPISSQAFSVRLPFLLPAPGRTADFRCPADREICRQGWRKACRGLKFVPLHGYDLTIDRSIAHSLIPLFLNSSSSASLALRRVFTRPSTSS